MHYFLSMSTRHFLNVGIIIATIFITCVDLFLDSGGGGGGMTLVFWIVGWTF
jgi:hypothetical protein